MSVMKRAADAEQTRIVKDEEGRAGGRRGWRWQRARTRCESR